MKKRTGTLLALLSIISPLHAWEGSLLLEEGIGKLRGFAQTPQGGDYNTTSERRPSFKEMGHEYDPFFHGEATIQYQHVWTFVNYFHLTPDTQTHLDNDLLTHNRFIPTNSPFDMNVHYNWYQAGIGFDTANYNRTWQFKPYVAANWLKYHYGFSSPIAHSHRDFNLLTATIGVKIEYCLKTCWLIDANAELALPISELELFEGSIGLNYTFLMGQHFGIRPRASIGMIYIDYEDLQKIPNHLRYQSSPYASLGLIFLVF